MFREKRRNPNSWSGLEVAKGQAMNGYSMVTIDLMAKGTKGLEGRRDFAIPHASPIWTVASDSQG
jgi:hypothetical protein